MWKCQSLLDMLTVFVLLCCVLCQPSLCCVPDPKIEENGGPIFIHLRNFLYFLPILDENSSFPYIVTKICNKVPYVIGLFLSSHFGIIWIKYIIIQNCMVLVIHFWTNLDQIYNLPLLDQIYNWWGREFDSHVVPPLSDVLHCLNGITIKTIIHGIIKGMKLTWDSCWQNFTLWHNQFWMIINFIPKLDE